MYTSNNISIYEKDKRIHVVEEAKYKITDYLMLHSDVKGNRKTSQFRV